MADRKAVDVKRMTKQGLHTALLEVQELILAGYRIPDPLETRVKTDWPKVGMGGRNRITLIKEGEVEEVVGTSEEATEQEPVQEAEAVVDDTDAETSEDVDEDTYREELKDKIKSLGGSVGNVKSIPKLEDKLKTLEEAAKA